MWLTLGDWVAVIVADITTTRIWVDIYILAVRRRGLIVILCALK